MRMLKTASVTVPEAITRAGSKACVSACVFLVQLTSMRQANGEKWTQIYWKGRVKWPISFFNISSFVILNGGASASASCKTPVHYFKPKAVSITKTQFSAATVLPLNSNCPDIML
jgi:hypothetical protein